MKGYKPPYTFIDISLIILILDFQIHDGNKEFQNPVNIDIFRKLPKAMVL